jgi:hypothetical protein
MPPKQAQQRLPFTPINSSNRALLPAESSLLSPRSSEQFEGIDNPIARPQSAPPSRRRGRRPPAQSKPRTSWVYNHMPDEDRETRYINSISGKPE